MIILAAAKAYPLRRCIFRLFIDEGGRTVNNWAAQLEAFPAERPDSGGHDRVGDPPDLP